MIFPNYLLRIILFSLAAVSLYNITAKTNPIITPGINSKEVYRLDLIIPAFKTPERKV